MPEPVIIVRGEAHLEGPPDLATVAVTVHQTGSDADQVRADLGASSAAIGRTLEEHQTAVDRLAGHRLHVAPVFAGRSGTRLSGYRGSVGTTVVVRDFDVLSDLVNALARLPQAQVDGPWWSLRPDNPMYREARLAAVADARRRAEDYAAAFEGTVGPVIEVSDLEAGLGGPRPRRAAFGAARAEAADPDFDFEPAVQSVSGSVTVHYALRLSS